ncbi:MAG: cyanophycinase [Firmicutes bacterium]|nr:cyanophycinase [Bacillota bacterium]
MKKIISIMLILLMLFSVLGLGFAEENSEETGALVIIGGALDPENGAIYNKIIELTNKPREEVKIAIIPAASQTPSRSGGLYKSDFVDLYNVLEENVKVFPIAVEDDDTTKDLDESTWSNNGFNEGLASEILKYDAVFFTGGSQLRIMESLIDEDGNEGVVLKSIREIYNRGGVIAGTSAGAAIMSDPMIGAGTSFGALTQGVTDKDNYFDADDNRVFLTKGLGFLENVITDQHFIKRGRFGRLITALLHTDTSMGYGIDENTALVSKGNELEVIGENGVMIIDTSKASKTFVDTRLKATGIIISYLEKGDKYNVLTKEFTINEKKQTTLGYEYYTGNKLNTNIFGKDSVVDTLTYDLVDNIETEAVGVSFNLEGVGIKLVFNQDSETKGYWGKIDGEESYAVANVKLDILPVKVEIIELNTSSTYIIKEGDTLINIAKQFDLKLKDIMDYNNIKNPTDIKVGQKLILE